MYETAENVLSSVVPTIIVSISIVGKTNECTNWCPKYTYLKRGVHYLEGRIFMEIVDYSAFLVMLTETIQRGLVVGSHWITEWEGALIYLRLHQLLMMA